MKAFFLLLLLCLTPLTMAEEGGWVTRDGKPVPNTDAMKSINGFGGWLIVTPDKDWEAKWNTPVDTTPHFNTAKNVRYGDELTILIFFINPKATPEGEINIRCDIMITRPDGTTSMDAKDVNCAQGQIQGSPRSVRLTTTVIKYIGEIGDPPGEWQVEVVLTDKMRNTTIPLKTQFVLLDEITDNPTGEDTSKVMLEDFGKQMMFFYLEPSKDAFIDLQKNADTFHAEINAAGNGSEILTSVLIARVAEKYDWPIEQGAYHDQAKEILAGETELAKYVANDAMVNPGKLDIWWVSYFATGETQYLDKIYQYAGLELPKGDVGRMLIIGAATWSFRSNCRQHSTIVKYAQQKIRHETEPKRTFLQECIEGERNQDKQPS